MTKHKSLKWGETPWDDMPRKDLLREVQRMYSALTSAQSALYAMSNAESSPWWSNVGTGGRALEKVKQALEAYDDGGRWRESIYRSFFRYADDLLFRGVGPGWMICDECQQMTGRPLDGEQSATCILCEMKGNPGRPTRPLTWSDVAPTRPVEPR